MIFTLIIIALLLVGFFAWLGAHYDSLTFKIAALLLLIWVVESTTKIIDLYLKAG